MKFKDLIFEEHTMGVGTQTKHRFDNNIVLSVLKGDSFYSDGVDTYEVGVFDENGDFTRDYFDDDIDDDVRGWLSESDVEKIIERIEKSA